VVAADGIPALAMTAAVLSGALVYVCRKEAYSSQQRAGIDYITRLIWRPSCMILMWQNEKATMTYSQGPWRQPHKQWLPAPLLCPQLNQAVQRWDWPPQVLRKASYGAPQLGALPRSPPSHFCATRWGTIPFLSFPPGLLVH